jgi:hypothetical protein
MTARLVVALALWSRLAGADPCDRVVVVDQKGKPVAGAVVFRMTSPESGEGFAQTDRQGRFCVPEGEWWGALDIVLPDERGGRCAGNVRVPSDQKPTRVVMHVDDVPTTLYTGHVVDEHGKPVAGALVEVDGVTIHQCGVTIRGGAKTAANGLFRISALRGDLEVLVHADGFATRELTLPPGTRDNRIVLDQGASWQGRVVAPDGKVVTSARVSLHTVNRDHVDFKVVDGAFDIARLTPTTWSTIHLAVDNHPVLGSREEWWDIKLELGAHRTEDLKFSSGLDIAGTTEPNSCVVALREDYHIIGAGHGMRVVTKSDASGHFVFHHLWPGEWAITGCNHYPLVLAQPGRTDVVLKK